MTQNEKKNQTIDARQAKQKAALIEQLKKTPIVKIACDKVGLARSTFYRWQDEDKEFGKAADMAIVEGKLLINDMSEYQLLSLIQEKNPSAIRYWLQYHHPDYMSKGRMEQQGDDSNIKVILLHDDQD